MEDRRHWPSRLGRLLAVTAAVIFPAAAESASPETRPGKLIEARLLADVQAVQPGKAFAAGVLLTVRPGWHVYWKNPGDAGLATAVELRLPKGFRAGPLHWPTPVMFRQAGDIVGYGYEGSVLLWADITPPKTLHPGRAVEIAAEVEYLACSDRCVPGEASVELRLGVAGRARPANAELFARWRRRLPAAADALDELVSADVTGHVPPEETSGRFTLLLKWRRPPREVQWYPAAGPALMIEDASVRTSGNETRVTFTARLIAGASQAPRSLETVAVNIDAKGARRGVLIRVPLGKAGHDPPPKSAKRS